MRRAAAFALVAGALLVTTPALAAQGVNLSWSRCHGEGASAQNATFACDTNVGDEVLVASFVMDAPLEQVSGNEVYIDLISQDDPLPAWWDLKNVGACRQSSLHFNTVEDPSDVVCVDWAAGASTGGIGSYNTEMGSIDPSLVSRHRLIKIALAVPLTGLMDLLADTEYFSCNLVIDHEKTVGTDACGGCAGSVCLVFRSIRVTTPTPTSDLILFSAATPGSNMVHWQGTGANCLLVPVRNQSWGQVKSLYR
jgi:hypothetical protein